MTVTSLSTGHAGLTTGVRLGFRCDYVAGVS